MTVSTIKNGSTVRMNAKYLETLSAKESANEKRKVYIVSNIKEYTDGTKTCDISTPRTSSGVNMCWIELVK